MKKRIECSTWGRAVSALLCVVAWFCCVACGDAAPKPTESDAEVVSAGQALSAAHLPDVPSLLVRAGGVLPSTELNQLSCDDLRDRYGIPYASSARTVNTDDLEEYTQYSCAQFRNAFFGGASSGTAVIDHSVRITDACTFNDSNIVITKSNVKLHCGGSTFDGRGRVKTGLTLFKRDKNDSAPRTAYDVIRNVWIGNCTFRNYTEHGVMLTNHLNRYNARDQELYDSILESMHSDGQWDVPGLPSAADTLRGYSPSGFYLGNITIENTGKAALYVHDHLRGIDINRLDVKDVRLGVYMDHGSRDNKLRNSCFRSAKNGEREYVAIDSSARNVIESNLFYRNVRGGVFLYKNCSENAEAAPQQFYRRQQAVKNLIQSNVIVGTDPGGTNYAGVNIASRQWAEEPANKPCGDDGGKVLQQDEGDRDHFPDYASNNTVSDNVFFVSMLGVRVKDDDNKVLNNQFYVPVGSTKRVIEVGTPRDLTYGGGPLKGTVIDGNWVDDYSGTRGTSTVHDDLFRLRERSMEHSAFSNNRYLGAAVCRAPFYVGSTNVAGEVCRFGELDDPELFIEGARMVFTDGGRIHGRLDATCTDDGWRVNSGYCCSGSGCAQVSLAGNVYE